MSGGYYKEVSKRNKNIRPVYLYDSFPCVFCKWSYGEVGTGGFNNLLCTNDEYDISDYSCMEEEKEIRLNKIKNKKRVSDSLVEVELH